VAAAVMMLVAWRQLLILGNCLFICLFIFFVYPFYLSHLFFFFFFFFFFLFFLASSSDRLITPSLAPGGLHPSEALFGPLLREPGE
jgi:hypothetical protein